MFSPSRINAEVRMHPEGGGNEAVSERFEHVECPQRPDTLQLVQFWHDCEAADGFKVGRDVPSRPLMRLLNNLALFEPLTDGSTVTDLRVRLLGDAVRQLLRRDISGKRLSETFRKKEFAARLALAKECLAANAPVIVDVQLSTGSYSVRRWESVLLPVWNRDKSSRWLLAGVFPFG